MVDQVSAGHIRAQTQQASKKLELGLLGLLVGDAAEKPGNIAALAIVLAFIALVLVIVFMDANEPKQQVITALTGIISGALGFLFGKSK